MVEGVESVPYKGAMRYSRAFIPTVKEVPKEATMPSHVLMLRAGYARMVGAGIYELRVRHQRVHYRLLYFFHEGRAVVTNGLTKEDIVSPREIELARRRKAMFEQNPDQHTHGEQING